MSPAVSGSPAVMLTPGRTRNIAQDMEALRLSRQDNPYLQVKFNSLNNEMFIIIIALKGR